MKPRSLLDRIVERIRTALRGDNPDLCFAAG